MNNLEDHCRHFHSAIFSNPESKERNLADDLIPAGTLNLEEAFEVYREGYSARAAEALGEIYETLWKFWGDEQFFEIIEDYILKNPSQSQNLYHWGAGLPDFLKTNQHDELVIELARFCWLQNQLFHRSSKEVPVLEIPGLFFQREFEIFNSSINVPTLWSAIQNDASVDEELNQPSTTVLYLKDQRVHFSNLNIDADFLSAIRELSEGGSLSLEKLFENLPHDATDSANTEEQVQSLFKHLRELGLFFDQT